MSTAWMLGWPLGQGVSCQTLKDVYTRWGRHHHQAASPSQEQVPETFQQAGAVMCKF